MAHKHHFYLLSDNSILYVLTLFNLLQQPKTDIMCIDISPIRFSKVYNLMRVAHAQNNCVYKNSLTLAMRMEDNVIPEI